MKKEGAKSTTLLSEKLLIENKMIYVDLKENSGGRFMQIAEISNDRRSTVAIPSTGLGEFMDAVGKVASEIDRDNS